MRQRGRKSAELIALPNVASAPSRLSPPTYLNAKERKLFVELINACDPRHFVESDMPLLVAYVQAVLLSRATAHKRDDVQVWEKATRMLATLATRLRLAPQARTDPKTIARQQHPAHRAPWLDLRS
jgi:hypothetical protein